MSENPESVEGAEHPEVPAVPESAAPESAALESPAPAKKKRFPRRRVATLTGAVLLLGAVVGGTGYTVVTVQDADRDPGKPSWKFPKAAADQDAPKAKGLRGMLMPYEENGFAQGPDLDEFGADAELSGRQATALRKESLKGLPPADRRKLEKQLDRQHIKGVVMRSYLNNDRYAAYADKVSAVSVTLTQMESQAAVRNSSTSEIEFFEALGIMRKGPKIDGHKNATCFLSPKDKDEKIDWMFCSAYVGDVLVAVNASGVAPLDKEGISTFLAAQLDRIDDPGKAV
ncbi:hypothetical protein B1R27_14230 [Streptomyces sp. GKU 895]|nr:hypothetical protein B1R27_14230 [Streptomyces sp. GKU 895]